MDFETNSTNFPLNVKQALSGFDKKFTKDEYLKYHQYIVQNYVINNNKSRGLLLFHEMGYGKSILAVSIAEYYRRVDTSRKVVVLLTKSLVNNFKLNIAKYIKANISELYVGLSDSDINNIVESYKFISLNASNMYSQMTRVRKTSEEIILEKQLNTFADAIERDNFLENSVLIVDEFHNLANSITNGSYNAIRLYDTIMKTKNIKLLFLTGTPVVNNPFELVPTFNMLAGTMTFGKIKTPLFPELKKNFDMYFINPKTNQIKNRDKFQNRIYGLCSYYGSMYFGERSKGDFPTELPIIVEKIHMSSEQFARYDESRDLEKEESSMKGRVPRSERFSAKGSVSSSYRVKTRQISNYCIPEYALGPRRGKKSRAKYIHKISKSDLLKTKTFSPKFGKIIQNIQKHKNQLGIFYSEFVSGEGIGIFARVLDAIGYKNLNNQLKDEHDEELLDIKLAHGVKKGKSKGGSSNLTYAIISGDIHFDERESIVKQFNDPDNISGKHISLLLISKTGAEGLDLKNVRHIHICEPYWNYARLSQIIARGVRYKSHINLPAKDRNVQSYIYLSTHPTDFSKKKIGELTTDEQLYTDAVNARYLINQFYAALASASIDCSMYKDKFSADAKKNIKCVMCSPDDKQLFHPLISKDVKLPNPCKELVQSKVKAKEIVMGDKKYAYQKGEDKYNVFKYDESRNAYTVLQEHEDAYAPILRQILKLE